MLGLGLKTHDILCYITHYITHQMLCYKTHIMLC